MNTAKNAVVTGGASGMGLEMARHIMDRGGKVLIADMDEDALDAALDDLGEGATGFKADVSKEADVEAMADAALERLGKVDLVFANAGLQFDAPTRAFLARCEGELRRIEAGAEIGVDEIEASRRLAHQRLTGSRLARLHLCLFQHVRAAKFAHLDAICVAHKEILQESCFVYS